MISILRFSFFPAALILLLSACATPGQAPKASQSTHGNNDLARLPPIAMLPPERAMTTSLNGPQVSGTEPLLGLGSGAIRQMFGDPDFKRHDPPAEIWQYRTDGCLLDVFLYRQDGSPGEARVKYIDVRGRSINLVSAKDCLLETLAR